MTSYGTVPTSNIFSIQEILRIKIQVITVPGKDSRAPAPRESRPDEEKGEAERVEESGLRQEIGGIHYPELLVILERSLRATASDALEEYKKLRRGSWVLRTMPPFSYFFFLRFTRLPLPRLVPFCLLTPVPLRWIRILLGIQVEIYADIDTERGLMNRDSVAIFIHFKIIFHLSKTNVLQIFKFYIYNLNEQNISKLF